MSNSKELEECLETLHDEVKMQEIASSSWAEEAEEICGISSAKELANDEYQSIIYEIEQVSEKAKWACNEHLLVAHRGIVHFYNKKGYYSDSQ